MRFSKFSPDFPHSAVTGIISFTIIQNPYSSVNPRKSIREIIAVALQGRGINNLIEQDNIIIDLLYRVGLTKRDIVKYLHQFSGGQRQRISIARSLAMNPEFIVADELFQSPYHPYTQALLSAIPALGKKSISKKKRILLKGRVPTSIDLPPGCFFQTRCFTKVGKICEEEMPSLIEVSKGHKIACHQVR